MARKAWIAVFGLGLVLLVLFDIIALDWAIHSEKKFQAFGFFSGLLFVTWQDFLALKRRIENKAKKLSAVGINQGN